MEQQIASWSAEEKLSWIAISCPLCRQVLEHGEFENERLRDIKQLKQTTDLLALDSLKENVREIIPGSHPGRKLKRMSSIDQLELAYRKLAFYQCGKCLRPYCGGTISCSDAADQAFSEGPNPPIAALEENPAPPDVPMELDGQENPVPLLDDSLVDDDEHGVESKREAPSGSDETDDDYDVSSEDHEEVEFLPPADCILEELLKLVPEEPELPPEEPEPQGVNEPSVEDSPPEVEDVGQKFKYTCLECLTNKPCGHPTSHLIYKCIKCCSVATFYCLGTEFYCDRCHGDLKTVYVCPGRKKCPLGISHPPNRVGTHGGGAPVVPFVVGCRICGIVSYSMDDVKLDQFSIDYY